MSCMRRKKGDDTEGGTAITTNYRKVQRKRIRFLARVHAEWEVPLEHLPVFGFASPRWCSEWSRYCRSHSSYRDPRPDLRPLRKNNLMVGFLSLSFYSAVTFTQKGRGVLVYYQLKKVQVRRTLKSLGGQVLTEEDQRKVRPGGVHKMLQIQVLEAKFFSS